MMRKIFWTAWYLDKIKIGCQTIVEESDLEIQIPKYTNMVSENVKRNKFDISDTAAKHLSEMMKPNTLHLNISKGFRLSRLAIIGSS